MNPDHPNPKKNDHAYQSMSADKHGHIEEGEESGEKSNNAYKNKDSHDHDKHLEKTVGSRDTKGYQRTLLISFLIITGYMFVEAIGGWLTGSLALLSDAGHMLSDAIALGATLMAFKIGEKAATHQKTYGYKRFEIVVASINGATLIIIALMIFYEAIERFSSPPEIATQGMLIIATIGMLVNILVAWLMHRGSRSGDNHGHGHGADEGTATVKTADNKEPVNLNMQSAYLHVLSDLMGSVAAIIAALLMMTFGWVWADATASVIVAALILISGYRVVRDSVHILMEGTPAGISLLDVEQKLLNHPQVQTVHDLHVWSITSGLNALSCHVVVDGDMSIHESSLLIASLEKSLLTLSIHHATIQVESPSHAQTNTHSSTLICDISEQAVDDNNNIGHNH